MKHNSLLHYGCKQVLLTAFCLAIAGIPSSAQVNVQASSPIYSNSSYDKLVVCDVATCGAGAAQAEVTTIPQSLNADMATIASDGTGGFNAPSYFGINGTGNYMELFGVAYSGVNTTGMPHTSGFTINTSTQQLATSFTGEAYELPYGGGVTANDPDIAIGTIWEPGIGWSHVALVVYEVNGDIFLEKYNISVGIGGVVTVSPPPLGSIMTSPQKTGQYKIREAGQLFII